MRQFAIGAVLVCVGVLGGEQDTLLKVGDTLTPCYPQHIAGPDKNSSECAS